MPDLQISGGGVAAIHADALEETLGDQKAYWSDAIRSAYIGANPKIFLKRNGTTVYQTTFTGSATTNGDGDIQMPGALGGSPAVHSAADIDSGAWTCRIEKADDSAKAIEGTLGPPGSGAEFILSRDLDGSTAVTVGTLVLHAPSTLDFGYVPGGGGGDVPAYDPQTTVNDMGLDNDSTAMGFSNAWSTGYIGSTKVTPGFVAFGNRGIPSEQAPWFTQQSGVQPYMGVPWRYQIPWMVPYVGAAHNCENLGVLVERGKFLGRRRSDGAWVITRSANGGYSWFPASMSNATQIPGSIQSRSGGVNGSVVQFDNTPQRPANQRYVHHGVWGGLQYFDPTPYDAILHVMTAQLVLWNAAGVDQRSSSMVVMGMGGDSYPTTGGFSALGGANLPPFAGSRLKRITATKQWFSACNLSNCRQDYVGPNASVSVQSFLNNPPPRALVEA